MGITVRDQVEFDPPVAVQSKLGTFGFHRTDNSIAVSINGGAYQGPLIIPLGMQTLLEICLHFGLVLLTVTVNQVALV